MTYLAKNVLEVTKDTLYYIDENNQKQAIDLLECSKNWVECFNTNIDDYITMEGKKANPISFENNTCVGERDWFAEMPYIEFFSNPKIRFEVRPQKRIFDIFNKNWKMRYYKEFRKIPDRLLSNGWTTFDLG